MRSKTSKKLFSLFISLIMVFNMVPTSAVAEAMSEQQEAAQSQSSSSSSAAPSSPEQAQGSGSQDGTATANPGESGASAGTANGQDGGEQASEQGDGEPAQDSSEPAAADAQSSAGQQAAPAAQAEPAKSAPFDQSQAVDGVTVSVKALAGAFPEGSKLSVAKVAAPEQAKVDEAVAAERKDGPGAEERANVVASFTYDIKVLGADGAELQPADGHKIDVSFALPQAADANLTSTVYHVEEQKDEKADEAATGDESAATDEAVPAADGLQAQRLESKEDEKQKTVTAATDGFSYYTVEFTYGELQYAMHGDSSVKLADILKTVGLTGEPQAATTSNPELFSASKDSGEWVVTAHKAFTTKEWMKVTIAGVEYKIDVTDDQAIRYRGETTLSGGSYYVDGAVSVTERIQVTGPVSLTLNDGAKLTCVGIDVGRGASLTIEGRRDIDYFSQSVEMGKKVDDFTSGKLFISPNSGDTYPGIDVDWTAKLVVNGGMVIAQATPDNAAGIGSRGGKTPGQVNINGGYVEAQGGQNGAGIGGGNQSSGGRITITGGEVDARGGKNAAGIGGGNQGDCDAIFISGGTINAMGGDEGAGIGSGNDTHLTSSYGRIVITGGTVGAIGGVLGAGIGSGADAGSGLASIEISGSHTSIDALGNFGAAGVGGGSSSGCEHISISNDAYVKAEGQLRGSGIGGGAGRAATQIDITNAKVYATGGFGAGIGSGAGAIGNKDTGRIAGGRINITNSTVLAHSRNGGAGIGGGIHGDGGEITISGGMVAAQGGASHVDSQANITEYGGRQFKDYTDVKRTDISNVTKDVVNELGIDTTTGRIISFGFFGDVWDTLTYPVRKTWDAIGDLYELTWKGIAELYSWPYDVVTEIIGSSSKKYQDIYYTGAGIGGGYRCAGGQVTIRDGARVDAQAGKTDHDIKPDGDMSASIGRGKTGPDPTGPQPSNTSIYEDAKVTHGPLTPTSEVFGSSSQNVYYRNEAEVATGRTPNIGLRLNAVQYAVIEPGECQITVEKQWEPDARLGYVLGVDYGVDYYTGTNDLNKYTQDSFWLHAGSVPPWQETISISNPPRLWLRETPLANAPGNGVSWETSWKFYYWDEDTGIEKSFNIPVDQRGRAVLDLKEWSYDIADLVDKNEYRDVKTSVSHGTARIVLTNTRKKTYSVQKQWSIDEEGKYKPASVKAVLQKKDDNGSWATIGQAVTLNTQNKWKADFEPVSDLGDDNYRVRELDASNNVVETSDQDQKGKVTYDAQVDGVTRPVSYTVQYTTNEAGLTTITNEWEQPTIVHGKKTWVDNNNENGKRPSSINVHLMANGSIIATKTVTPDANGKWEWAFDSVSTTDANGNVIATTALPRYDKDGKEIKYSVSEDVPDGYEGVSAGYRVPGVVAGEGSSSAVAGGATDKVDVEGYDLVNVLKNNDGVPIIVPIPIPVPTPPVPTPPTPTPPNPPSPDPEPEDPKTDDDNEKKKKDDDDDNKSKKITVTVTKEWKDNNNEAGKRPDEITINLFKNGIKIKSEKMRENDGKWKLEFKELETKLSIAGQSTSVPCVYTISEDRVPGYTTEIERDVSWTNPTDLQNLTTGNTNYKITNTYNQDSDNKVTYSVKKEWDIDALDQDRPSSITARLQKKGANGKWDNVQEVEVTAADGWKKDFAPVDNNGTYRIREVDKKGLVHDTEDADVPEDEDGKKPDNSFAILDAGDHDTKYLVDYETDEDEHTTTIKNTAVLDITINKRWLMFGNAKEPDDGDAIWNSIYLMLMSRPKAEEGGESTPYMPVYNALYGDGLDASGGVDAAFGVLGLDGVMSTFQEFTGFDINDYITANIAMAKVTKDGEWKATFGVKKYNEAGLEQEFLGAEMVTGLMAIAAKSLTGVDFPVMIRPIDPKFFTVFGKAYCIPVLCDDWELSSNVINTWYEGDPSDGDPDITIGGTKIWDDGDGQGRPNSATLKVMYKVGNENKQLYKKTAEGGQGDAVTVSVTGEQSQRDWVWSLGLKKSDLYLGNLDGVTEETFDKSKLSVEEDPVPTGYTATYNRFDVTNKKGGTSPETTSIAIKKTWADNNDQDGIRPSSVSMLVKSGNEVVKRVALSKSNVTAVNNNEWTATVGDLPKQKNGEDINYTIEEETTDVLTGTDGPGTYAKSEVSGAGTTEDPFTITNTHTPETINLAVHKAWQYNGQAVADRPTELTVQLQANGQQAVNNDGTDIADITLTSTGNWNAIVNNLPKYKDGKKIQYSWVEGTLPAGYSLTGTREEGNLTTLTNTYNATTTSSTVRKLWEDSNDKDGKRPDSVAVQLRAKHTNNEYNVVKTYRLSEDCDWQATVVNLPLKFEDNSDITYEWVELEEPEGYDATTSVSGTVTTITNTRKLTVDVRKVWDDGHDRDEIRPTSVTVNLLGNGVAVNGQTPLTLSASNNWAGSFTELSHATENGDPITYTVSEDAVSNYETSIAGDAAAGFTITNKHTPTTNNKVNVSVQKIWNDDNNRDGKRPDSVTIHLKANDNEIDSKTITARNNWRWEFKDLPKQKGNTDVTYTVTEDAVQDYTTTVSEPTKDDGGNFAFTITNTYTPKQVTISGTKVWDDGSNQDGVRPGSIMLRLLANGSEVAQQKVTSAPSSVNNWSWTFGARPKYRDGKEISYSVAEDSINGYETTIAGNVASGFTITNKHEPATTIVSGTKTWNDANNQDGKRPQSITIKLKADGQDVAGKTQTVTTADGWKWQFTGLPKYKNNGTEIIYTVEEEDVANYKTTYDNSRLNVTNTHTPETVDVTVTKTWNGDNNQDQTRPENITLRLLADGKQAVQDGRDVTTTVASATTAEASWKWEIKNLPKYKDGQQITYSVSEDAVPDYSTSYAYTTDGSGNVQCAVTNALDSGKTSLTVRKVWDDENDRDNIRPTSGVTVQLMNGNNAVGDPVTLSATNKWTHTFTGLNKDDEYTVDETDVPQGYTKTVTGNATEGYTITNKHEPKKRHVSVTVIWDDNHDKEGLRVKEGLVPVHILVAVKNNSQTDPQVDSSINIDGDFVDEDTWKGGFDHYYKEPDEPIEYRLLASGSSSYEGPTITGNATEGFVIKYVYRPSTTIVSGRKIWNDEGNKDNTRPESITIRLFANGTEVQSQTVTEQDGWSWLFNNLPETQAGQRINYTVTEDAVTDYTSEVDGPNVTNTYTPGKTQVNVSKDWRDNNDRDGLRPVEVTVRLLANGTDTGKLLKLSEADGWTGAFTDLDVKDAQGNTIEYTVKEEAVAGYESTVVGDATRGFIISNEHTSEKVSVPVYKVWNDNNSQSERPASVEVYLYANGKKVAGKTLTSQNLWQHVFVADSNGDSLPKYENGKEIAYTVSEKQVDNYSTTVSGSMQKGFTITNTRTPGKTSLSVRKVWQDDNNCDGKRPSTVTVQLLANGKQVSGKTLELNEANGWSGAFTELDQKIDNVDVVYTVEELDVGLDYNLVSNAGDAKVGYTLTNYHEPETIDILGTKNWDDNNDVAHVRPATVTIRLYANGVEVSSQKVNETSNPNAWDWWFPNRPKYKDGKEIAYTVSEDAVPNYQTTYSVGNDGIYHITNSYAPGKTQVTVHQVWADYDDQDKLRPETRDVYLYVNGVRQANKKVTISPNSNADADWRDTFDNLDVKDEQGNAYVYTVREDPEPAQYSTYYYGYAKRGFTIVSEHEPETVTISGTKEWHDEDDLDGSRPTSVTVRLLAKQKNDAGKDEVKFTKTTDATTYNNWNWEFADQPKKLDGKDVTYEVEEVPVAGYNSEVSELEEGSGGNYTCTITNTHVPYTVAVSGTKVWDDNNNQDAIRPQSIVVNLFADGDSVKETEVTLDVDGKWEWAFNNLPKHDTNGDEINYEVTENPIDGYEPEIAKDTAKSGENNFVYTITNRHAPETVNVKGAKTWSDEGNEGKRPESITVRLLANGKEVANKKVTADDDWKWEFANQTKFEAGKEIAYTITEDAVAGYTSAVTGDASAGFTVTNTYDPSSSTPDGKQFKITYKLNGGTFDGSADDIVETYDADTVISIHKAPTRDGYTFDYWKGSEYQPGDKYTVTEDHTFVAQWKQSGGGTPSGSSTTTGSTAAKTATAKTADGSASPVAAAAFGLALVVAAAIVRRRRRQ